MIFKRKPDFVIGNPQAPYLRRWWLTPRVDWLPRIYLHNILRSDDDRALHDHISWSISIILSGGYIERYPGGVKKYRKPGMVIFRNATQAHRLELYKGTWCYPCNCYHMHHNGREIPAWTIFIVGPKKREWGFHCPQGWLHWRDFIGVPTGEARGDEVGPDCS